VPWGDAIAYRLILHFDLNSSNDRVKLSWQVDLYHLAKLQHSRLANPTFKKLKVHDSI
jgi:hypothetical protein